MRMPQTPRQRVKWGCLHFDLTQVDLAKRIGVCRSEISHVASGRCQAGKIIEKVAKVLACSPQWLVEGRGDAPEWAARINEANSNHVTDTLRKELAAAINEIVSLRLQRAIRHSGVPIFQLAQTIGEDIVKMLTVLYQPTGDLHTVQKIAEAIQEDP